MRVRVLSDGTVLHWWKQVIAVLVVYGLFEFVRSRLVSARDVAFDNAIRVIDWQEALGINHELAIQRWTLNWMPLIVFSNYFYASTYLPITLGTLAWLYRKRSDAYLLWRDTLALMTTMGLIGFAFFPLMPPRLLDLLGDGRSFGFVVAHSGSAYHRTRALRHGPGREARVAALQGSSGHHRDSRS